MKRYHKQSVPNFQFLLLYSNVVEPIRGGADEAVAFNSYYCIREAERQHREGGAVPFQFLLLYSKRCVRSYEKK